MRRGQGSNDFIPREFRTSGRARSESAALAAIDLDLLHVVQSWPDLPDAIKLPSSP
jgi:hypothetical protein